MTTPYTWGTLKIAVAAALVQGQYPWTSNLPSAFVELLPTSTSYAEGRIARDLVLLNSRAVAPVILWIDSAAPQFLPPLASMTPPLIIIEGVDVLVAGRAYAYDKTSLDALQVIWPDPTVLMAPDAAEWIGRYWAMQDDQTAILAPTPDRPYSANVTGLFIQTPLSPSQSQSYIATVYGDLMFAATMLHLSGALLRNFGAAQDEPRMAQSWEGTYQALLPGAKAEEARRRGLVPDVETPPAGPAAPGRA